MLDRRWRLQVRVCVCVCERYAKVDDENAAWRSG